MKELIPRTINEVVSLINELIHDKMTGNDIVKIRKLLGVKAYEFCKLAGMSHRSVIDYQLKPFVTDKVKNILRGIIFNFYIPHMEDESCACAS